MLDRSSDPGETIGNRLAIRIFFVKLFDKLCCLIQWRKLDRILERYSAQRDDFFFVQIGANDGVIYDPIHKFVKKNRWRGLLVEPVPYYYDQLLENYPDHDRLSFENVAISAQSEVRDFYRISEKATFLPRWCAGLGTFHLDVLLTHRWAIPNIQDYVVTEQVTCIPLPALLEKHQVQTIDLLLIDTEGHDFEVIKQIDFDRLKPRMILFEHEYITGSDKQDCEALLKRQSYTLTRHMGNTLACA